MRVVVIGRGMAGFAAALGARDAGADVVVIGEGTGATGLSSGVWDIVSSVEPDAIPGRPAGLSDALRGFVRARPDHPYARLGASRERAIDRAHERVLDTLAEYHRLDREHGIAVATEQGFLRRAATAHRDVLALSSLAAGTVVGVAASPEQFGAARFLANSLEQQAPLYGLALTFRAVISEDQGARPAIDHGPIGRLEDCQAVLVAAAADGAARARWFEVATARGITAGLRTDATYPGMGLALLAVIDRSLAKAGCDVRSGRVRSLAFEAGSVEVDVGGEILRADAVVMATGKLIGGGITAVGAELAESLLGLPLFQDRSPPAMAGSLHGPDPVQRFGPSPFRTAPGFRMGVGYDAAFRALGASGHPVSPRVFVAGALLEGFDPSCDGTGLGCAATTGYVAGASAASGGSLGWLAAGRASLAPG